MRDPEITGGEPSSLAPLQPPPEGSAVPSGSEPSAPDAASEAGNTAPVRVATPSAAPRSVRPSAPRMHFEGLPPVGVGIRVKLIALTVSVIVGIVVVLASYFVTHQIDDLRVARRDRAEVYGELAAHQLRSSVAFNDEETAREVLTAVKRDPRVEGIAVYTEKGALLHREGTLSELAHAARGGLRGERRTFYLPGRVLAIAPVKSLEGPKGTVVLELSMRSVLEARDALVRAAFLVGALAVGLGALAAWLIARSLSHRVEVIAGAASAMAQGDLSQVVDVSGPNDEIGVLGHGFNAMSKKLRELFEHVQRTAREESARLERLVNQRTAELDRKNKDLRLVLDNVEQGFVTVDRAAHVTGEYSRAIESWLGPLSPSETLWDALERSVPGSVDRFGLGWEEVVAAILPLEVTLDQMPRRVVIGERHLSFEYKPLGGEDFDKLMVVITDVTATVARERSEREERDVLSLSSRLINDRDGFLEFYAETQNLVQRVRTNTKDLRTLKRDLHTLKGNTAIFGLLGISAECHELESRLELRDPETLDRSELTRQWDALCEKLTSLFGDGQHTSLQIDEAQYGALVDAIRDGESGEVLERMVRAWRLDPVRGRLERLSAQLAATAERIGKGPVHVTVDAPALYVAREELAEFWSVFAHVIRNAAAHGLETPEVRRSLGKPEVAEFELSARLDQRRLFIEIADTGPGIDWESLRAIAKERGLPHATDADLTNALFVDGVSTQSYVTDVSGRGVGLSAVRAVCERQKGQIGVVSTPGKGTRFTFSWPVSAFDSLIDLGAESRHAAE
jgi:two-component system chemotaxis sensor kinase CheA